MRTSWKSALFVATIAVGGAPGCPLPGQDNPVLLNQIQIIGTHNSYHAGLGPSEMKLLELRDRRTAQALDYSHPSLREQLTAGIRQIELDVFADPEGGRFAHPNAITQTIAAGLPPDPDFDPDHEMDRPGFKVMHLQDIDQRSRCHLFKRCLEEVRSWSKENPDHLPVFILVECKAPHHADTQGAIVSEPMTPALFDALDGEIRSVFPPSEIIVPDQVRGSHASLSEAISNGGWPILDRARGKVLFLLDNRDLAAVYAEGHPALKGRILFPNAEPGTPNAAFTELNSGSPTKIQALVREGYLVRTRADWDTLQARVNSTKRREDALASGAQIVSTDYPASEPSRWTGYSVAFPNQRLTQCDALNSSASCNSELLERPPVKRADRPVRNPSGE